MAGTSPVTPMLILTGISFGNRWYNTGQVDLKILVEGGIATALLAAAANIPGFAPVAAGIAWVALVAVSITPAQSPSPAQNLLKLTGG
jgi:hypothetical protein